MDTAKYLENRGWGEIPTEDIEFRAWEKGEYTVEDYVGGSLYIFHTLDCIFEIEGGFPSEEKADIIMEALGISI